MLNNAAHYDDFPDGVVIAGSAGQVIEVNEAAGRLLALSPHRAVGQDFRDVLPFVDLQGDDWWQQVNPYTNWRSGQPECLVVLGRGPRCGDQLLLTARSIRSHGRVSKLVISLRSTQDRRNPDQDRVDLVSTMAHEIRSPIATVKGFTSTLLEKWDCLTDDQRRLMLQSVHTDADRITRLLTDLVDVSRLDAHQLPLRRQPVNMPALIKSVVDGYVATGHDADHFRYHCSDLLPELWLDIDKVVQIVRNLVCNALHHGAGPITIQAGSWSPRGQSVAVLTVSDCGNGIPKEIRELVFSRLWHGLESQGTGLGLYLVRGLAQAHGGSAEVLDSPTGGAVVRVLLPSITPQYPEPRPAHGESATVLHQ